ncbi:MAG: hypothetical protein AAB131_21000 [Actinomycetota bacterium]
MTTTPVLPSLPEPFDHIHTLENSGDTDDVPVFTAEQMNDYARRAIESLSRAPAEPVAWIQHWPGLPDRVFDMTVIDPRKTTWSSGITYTLLYAHTTESAGPAAADYSEQLTKAKSLLTDWVNSFVDCIEGGEADPMVLATREFIALGESHEG